MLESNSFSLAGLIRQHADSLTQGYSLSPHHWKVLNALKECRTGSLGHVVMRCDHCKSTHRFPLSCGNRHCPVCTAPKREAWRAKQCQDLLPVPYFHVVFTVPHVLNPLIRDNREQTYALLFSKAVEILQQFAEQVYGGRLGITAVLHTWGQALGDHYHLHLMIPGGVLKPGATPGEPPSWVAAKPNCLFPVKQLSLCFRGAFIRGLEELYEEGELSFHSREMRVRAEPGAFKNLLRMACRPKWNVFSEKSKATPKGAVNYLARYSQSVALNEGRVKRQVIGDSGSGEEVYTLAYHDNKDGKDKVMNLSGPALLKRFCLHILPAGFVRIRHYGFLANGQRQERLAEARQSIEASGLAEMPVAEEETEGEEAQACPKCREAGLRWLWTVCVLADGRRALITPTSGSRRKIKENAKLDTS